MKKILSFIFAAFAAVSLTVSAPVCAAEDTTDVNVIDESYYESFRNKGITLNVYNWGEYISDGTDGSLNVIKAFEKISGIDVNYTNYATNEDLYAKLSVGATSVYDIIIPSDYMIAKMIDEDMLEKLNFDNIPNIDLIADEYRYNDFDPNCEYSVPYTWGTVGIIYNKAKVTKPVDSWDILWDTDYAGKILMFSNSRDAFAIALAKCGYSLNTTDESEIREAEAALREQKPIVQDYVMDQVFDKMRLEEAWIAPYYAGDALTMMADNPNLAFAYPKETVNVFIDSICVPKNSKNKDAAEAFINFLCEPEVAAANCEYICYSTPNTGAMEILGEEIVNNPITYPDLSAMNVESFTNLPRATNELQTELWNDVLIGIENSGGVWMSIVGVIIALALVILIILLRVRKAKKKQMY